MDYTTLWNRFFAETVVIAATVATATAGLSVAILTLWDPVQYKLDSAEASLRDAEQELETSIQSKQEIEQNLAVALEEISVLQDAAAGGEELDRLQNLLNQRDDELVDIEREHSEIKQRLTEALAIIDAAGRNTFDPTIPASWMGTWGGRYLCSTGSRREGLVRWQITNSGNGSLLIDELAARENPEPNSYNVHLSGDSISGSSGNGRYRVSATLQQNGIIYGDWPGHACGQVVLAKLF